MPKRYSAITGVSGWVPETVLTNAELEKMVDTTGEMNKEKLTEDAPAGCHCIEFRISAAILWAKKTSNEFHHFPGLLGDGKCDCWKSRAKE